MTVNIIFYSFYLIRNYKYLAKITKFFYTIWLYKEAKLIFGKQKLQKLRNYE